MKGRKAIPNKIIELRGGASHTHRAERKEPDIPQKIPPCPAHLNKESKKEWHRVSKILDSIGLLTELDRSTLAEYCEAYGKWVELKRELMMLAKVYQDNAVVFKNTTCRVEQYRGEVSRWHEAVKKNAKGVVFKKENGEPFFSPYLKLERDSAEKLQKIEYAIKREIRDTDDRLLKAGTLVGMSPSARASLSINNQATTTATDKTELFRMAKHGK